VQRRNLPEPDLIAQYRAAFSTRAGQTVLVNMLDELMVFSHMESTAEDVALKNYGLRLLAILGGGGLAAENVEDFTMRLMRQPINKPEKEEE